jgi:hypothetical protein
VASPQRRDSGSPNDEADSEIAHDPPILRPNDDLREVLMAAFNGLGMGLGGAFPTICGTGTEDYFCGAYNFDPGSMARQLDRDMSAIPAYVEFTTPYAGLPQVIRPDGLYRSQQRFGMYRWHIMDPVRFETDLRVMIQALGWRTDENRRYLPLQDDIASTAFWYQTLPTAPFPTLPDRDYLEVV